MYMGRIKKRGVPRIDLQMQKPLNIREPKWDRELSESHHQVVQKSANQASVRLATRNHKS